MNVLEQQLSHLVDECRPYTAQGKVADYIPELAHVKNDLLGVAICLPDGTYIHAGDVHHKFTIQSVSKALTLCYVLMEFGEDYVFSKVGMEPTGDAFNSIAKLEETVPSKPLNPMINAGALAVTSMILGETAELKIYQFRQFLATLLNRSVEEVTYDEKVARSEYETTDLNRALLYFMRHHGIVDGDVDEIIDVYTKQCAIEIDCFDLARIGRVFAGNGEDPDTGEELIPRRVVRIVKAIMTTCGMYDASGEFAVRVGLPGKSGVSGAILAVGNHELDLNNVGFGIFGPALDSKGNSIAGIKLLELLIERYTSR